MLQPVIPNGYACHPRWPSLSCQMIFLAILSISLFFPLFFAVGLAYALLHGLVSTDFTPIALYGDGYTFSSPQGFFYIVIALRGAWLSTESFYTKIAVPRDASTHRP